MPFLVVSGSIEEAGAVSALKAGAHDFLIKNKLARLLPAIQRELKEAENRREHRQADDSLRVSELRFRSTLESMVEGYQVIGYDWRYRYLNDSAVKHSRQTREELLGRTMMECYPGIERTALFPALQRCMDERTSQHVINEFIYPDGSRGWFELSIQPAPDGIFILSTDITRHKQAEQALLEREMKLTILLEILPVGISILDAEHKVCYINSVSKRMLDISEEELLGGTYRDRKYLRADETLMSVDELASTQAFKEKRELHGVETGVVKEDGSIVWTSMSAVPVDFSDWKVVTVTADITERKKAENEILKLNTDLERRVAERTVELAAANEQLIHLSLFDELTDLYNRRGFLLRAEEQLRQARLAKHKLLIFYADLDGLKQINDKFSHAAGDKALVEVAAVLRNTFRMSYVVARFGGDEFIVLAMKAEEQDAVILLARLREELALNGLSVSVGVIAMDPQSEESIDFIIGRADQAMYAEKRNKPNRRKA